MEGASHQIQEFLVYVVLIKGQKKPGKARKLKVEKEEPYAVIAEKKDPAQSREEKIERCDGIAKALPSSARKTNGGKLEEDVGETREGKEGKGHS